jgi:hypothetical protein
MNEEQIEKIINLLENILAKLDGLDEITDNTNNIEYDLSKIFKI